jgi:hypothetical protein
MLTFYLFEERSNFVIQNHDEMDLLSIDLKNSNEDDSDNDDDDDDDSSSTNDDDDDEEFIVRDLSNHKAQFARIRDRTEPGSFWEASGPYTYDICAPTPTTARRRKPSSSSVSQVWATVSQVDPDCCSSGARLFELKVFDKDKTRTYDLENLSFFTAEFMLSRHGSKIATYTRPWLPWRYNQVDLDETQLCPRRHRRYHHERNKENSDDDEDDDNNTNKERLMAIVLCAYVIVTRILQRVRARQQQDMGAATTVSFM